MDLISLHDVRAAAGRLDGVAARTPLVACPWVSGEPGATRLWLKPENQQPVGSFKIRGAYNAIAQLPPEQRAAGVITHSSGNHARAVAAAARSFGIRAVVVMPENSVPIKMERVRDEGAEVVPAPMAERLSVMERLAVERGMSVIPPYDHPHVIAGQGTVGMEITEDLPDVDVVLAPIGGGGLISGIATAVKATAPRARVIGVEPEQAADAQESFRAGVLKEWSPQQRGRTIADGLRTNVCELTLAHITAHVDDVITVSEAEIRATMGVLLNQADITVEPSGAVAAAGYLYHREKLPEGKTVAVLTGGNVDPALLAELRAG
ncbi:MAG: threonine ammonia-lyase [Micromonosporaceae bacterium]